MFRSNPLQPAGGSVQGAPPMSGPVQISPLGGVHIGPPHSGLLPIDGGAPAPIVHIGPPHSGLLPIDGGAPAPIAPIGGGVRQLPPHVEGQQQPFPGLSDPFLQALIAHLKAAGTFNPAAAHPGEVFPSYGGGRVNQPDLQAHAARAALGL